MPVVDAPDTPVTAMSAAPSPTRFASPELAHSIVVRYGEHGERWLAGIDRTIDAYARAWDLRLGEPVHGGRSSVLVAATTAGGRPALLKVVPNPVLAQREFEALSFFARSTCSIQVLERDLDGGALLLERLEPAIPFTEHDSGPEMFRLVGRTLRSLHDLSAEPHGPYMNARDYYIYERLCQAARRLHHLPRGATVPTIHDMHAALDICERLLDTRDRSDDHLLHGDPSPGNVLWAGPERGVVTIDPQPSIGERALDTAICAVKSSWGRHVRERAQALAEGAGYDPERVWLWSRVVALDHCVAHNTHGYGDEAERAALLATARGMPA